MFAGHWVANTIITIIIINAVTINIVIIINMTIRPAGVEHCRKQFQHFPCCDLKAGGIRFVSFFYFPFIFLFFRGLNSIDCGQSILKQFKNKGHFSCDDLIKDDPEALFFFIKENKDLTYQCISVCHTSGARMTMMGHSMAIASLILSMFCLP